MRSAGPCGGAVDRSTSGHRARVHQRIEQLQPEAAPDPAVEAIVDRSRRAIDGRTVAPATVQFRGEVDWIESEAIRVIWPGSADIFVRRKAAKGFSRLAKL